MKSVLTELSYQATNCHVPNLRKSSRQKQAKTDSPSGQMQVRQGPTRISGLQPATARKPATKGKSPTKATKSLGAPKIQHCTKYNLNDSQSYIDNGLPYFFQSCTNPIRSNRTKNAHNHWICIHLQKQCPKMPR